MDHKMENSKKKYLSAILSALLIAAPALVQAGAQDAQATAGLYDITPEPLTVAQCGQCHPGVFKLIKDNGARHRISCARCHTKFHAYTPNKPNWAEIMPQCSQCHTLPHGEAFGDCTTCHIVPHTPKRIPLIERVTSSCGTCHTGPSGEMAQFPSKHKTDVTCQECHHDRHGYIPSCMECHEPHLPGQQVDECLACHPVHKPLEITYGPDDSQTCSACHEDVFAAWSHTASKHGQVACADCHEKHGQIPDCAKCHGVPHDVKLLQKFPRCLDCHIDVHDLPMQ